MVHFVCMRQLRTVWQIISICISICLADMAWCKKDLSDAEKKEVVYGMYADYRKEFPEVKHISPQKAMDLLNRKEIVFVDIRKPAERAVSMLPGAVSKQKFLDALQNYRDKIVVAYCTISYRSGLFARDMAKQGLPVLNLQGGILAWILEGGKVYDAAAKPVKRVHVYGDKWNYAPADYESVTFALLDKIF